MIHSICGLQNSGKTLIASWLAWLDFMKGRKVLSNIHLNFPHFLINKDFISYLALKQPVLRNVTFIIDEAWIWYDSYAALQEKAGSYFFLQSSKDNSNIYLTAQNNEQNMKRIRQNLHRYTECKRVIYEDKKFKPILVEERDLERYRTNKGEKLNDILFIQAINYKRVLDAYTGSQFSFSSNLYIKAKRYFNLYNTYEKRKII